jgi:hypothetical protein
VREGGDTALDFIGAVAGRLDFMAAKKREVRRIVA